MILNRCRTTVSTENGTLGYGNEGNLEQEKARVVSLNLAQLPLDVGSEYRDFPAPSHTTARLRRQ